MYTVPGTELDTQGTQNDPDLDLTKEPKRFPGGSAGKESSCTVGDLGSIPGLGRFPGEGNSYPLQYSGMENSMNCIVHGITKSRIQLKEFHSLKESKERDSCMNR